MNRYIYFPHGSRIHHPTNYNLTVPNYSTNKLVYDRSNNKNSNIEFEQDFTNSQYNTVPNSTRRFLFFPPSFTILS